MGPGSGAGRERAENRRAGPDRTVHPHGHGAQQETGLDIAEIIRVLPPAYSAVGLSNEQCICVFGVAEGEIAPCRETGEEITARWYSRGELREMLKSCTFGSWAQAYSYMWTEGF